MPSAKPEAERAALAQDILGYWRILAYLSQPDFPRRDQAPGNDGEGPSMQYEDGPLRVFPAYRAMRERFMAGARKTGRRPGESITVYIGRTDREQAISAIARALDLEDYRAEKDDSQIAFASFQLDEDGLYLPGTFSLSPVLWAAHELAVDPTAPQASLSPARYQAIQESFERILDPDPTRPKPLTPPQVSALWDRLSAFSPSRNRDMEAPEAVFAYIGWEYPKTGEWPEEPYEPLSAVDYASDLALVQAAMTAQRPTLPQYLLSYILALGDRAGRDKNWVGEDLRGGARFDLVWNRQDGSYEDVMGEIMRITHAPLGKWPSMQVPNFLQQGAINLRHSAEVLRAEDVHDAFRLMTPMLSVNATAGSNNPSIVREVIAGGIVERARIMASREDPDSFFEWVPFGMEDAAYDPADVSETAGWYRLTDGRLARSGIVVATPDARDAREEAESLVRSQDLLAGLTLDEESPRADGLRKMRRDLLSREGHNVFFSALADGLYAKGVAPTHAARALGSQHPKREQVSTWGLIAAPMPDAQGVQRFVRDVLEPLLEPKGECAQWWHLRGQDRLKEYESARVHFLDQLQRVLKLRSAIDADYLEEKTAEAHEHTKHAQAGLAEQEKLHKQMREALSLHKKRAREIDARIEAVEEEMDDAAAGAEQPKQSFLSRFGAGRKRYEQDLWAAEESQETFDRLSDEHEQLLVEKELEQKETRRVQHEVDVLQQRIDEWRAVVRPWEEAEDSWRSQLEEAEANGAESAMADEEYYDLGSEFFEVLADPDSDDYAAAQAANPWATDTYNREREKLLLCALRLNREFILSSKAMRANLETLSAYLEYVVDSEPDPKQSGLVTSLMHTLSLLVPAICTTYSFIGTLFKDVAEAESLGLFIGLDAQCVQPFEALGALYRSSKSLILGDTRLGEPTVGDDLDAIRQAFSARTYAPYLARDASVQSACDYVNPFGTVVEETDGSRVWMSGPLVVSRGIGDPMFTILNEMSYDTLLVRTHRPADPGPFLMRGPRWINVAGSQKGPRNLFVPSQGRQAADMVRNAFDLAKGALPDMIVITPFRTVAAGLRQELAGCREVDPGWIRTHVGTLEEMRGRRAQEVLFVLGCDAQSRSAVRSLDRTAVTQAVASARDRLYIMGDAEIWKENPWVSLAGAHLQQYAKRQAQAGDGPQSGSER